MQIIIYSYLSLIKIISVRPILWYGKQFPNKHIIIEFEYFTKKSIHSELKTVKSDVTEFYLYFTFIVAILFA